VALCIVGVIIAVIRRVSISSGSSLSKTMSSATARTPLSKSTGSIGGTDDTSELKESCEDSAGFESKGSYILESKGSSIFEDELSNCSKDLKSRKETIQLTSPSSLKSHGDACFSEQQLMLPKSHETFLFPRTTSEGIKTERFGETTSIGGEQSPFSKDTTWATAISESLLNSPFRETDQVHLR